MTDVIAGVFDELAARGHEPQLEKATATVRFDVKDGSRTQRWLLTVKKGDLQVSRRNAAADLVIRCDRTLAERLFTGKANAMSAVLRGELAVEGSAELLVLVQRLLPRPRTRPSEGSCRRLREEAAMSEVKILDGNTFVVSDDRGDIEASPIDATGLFSFDTRFLSTWVLTVNGDRLNALSVDDLQYFETRFFLVPGTGTVYIDAKLSVIRRRAVGGGFHEELTILNHDDKPVRLDGSHRCGLRLRGSVRGQGCAEEEGQVLRPGHGGRLVLGYERKTFRRETTISASTPAKVDKNGLTFTVRLEASRPRGRPNWTSSPGSALRESRAR